mmetsp:Transcript_81724/g.205640  ORF Transcript_81724/g.205640 Transcript_81724/m.205640 type:complete len:381 (+) Transcript_81724:65-1207(+)
MTLGSLLRQPDWATLAASTPAHVNFLAKTSVYQAMRGHKHFANLCWVTTQVIILILVVHALVAYVQRQRKQMDGMGIADCAEDTSVTNLQFKAVIGRGTFGTVHLVQEKGRTQSTFALKCVRFESMARLGRLDDVHVELDIATKLAHPCIMEVVKVFHDFKIAYILTEFLDGGDLFNAIREIGTLEKRHAHFYAGSIALALEHLHEKNIMYRDLKPENVMLNMQGRAKLIDFGCCKQAREGSTLIGTNEYIAPEAILRRTYTDAVDWWALGVMLHEFVVGPLPFGRDGQERLEIFQEILHAPLQYLELVSDETATSAITSLLQREPRRRLGSGGGAEVKRHAYFADVNWEALEQGRVAAPWVPDTQQISSQWEECAAERV